MYTTLHIVHILHTLQSLHTFTSCASLQYIIYENHLQPVQSMFFYFMWQCHLLSFFYFMLLHVTVPILHILHILRTFTSCASLQYMSTWIIFTYSLLSSTSCDNTIYCRSSTSCYFMWQCHLQYLQPHTLFLTSLQWQLSFLGSQFSTSKASVQPQQSSMQWHLRPH
jgi:hypothetical protein